MNKIFHICCILSLYTISIHAQTSPSFGLTLAAKGIVISATSPKINPARPLVYKDESIAQFKYSDVIQGMHTSYIYALLHDHRGNLWLGSWGKGFSRYDGTKFAHYQEDRRLKADHVWKLFEDSHNRIWIGTRDGGAICFDGINFTIYKDTLGGLQSNQVYDIYEDTKGNIWFATAHGVSRLKGDVFTHFSSKDGLRSNRVRAIVEDNDGGIWLGTWGAGLYRFDGKYFVHQNIPGYSAETYMYIWSMLVDKEGNLWASSWGNGLLKFDGKEFQLFNNDQGLIDLRTRPLFEGRNGKIWVGTEAGIGFLEDGAFKFFSTKDGLSNNFIYAITEDQEGNLWIGTEGGGVNRFAESEFEHFTSKNGLSHNIIWSMKEDQQGNIWFGGKRKGVSIYDGQQFIPYMHNDRIAGQAIRSIVMDSYHNMWLGTWGNGMAVCKGDQLRFIRTEDGLNSDYILSICEDTQGRLWCGTYSGLRRLATDSIPDITTHLIDSSYFTSFPALPNIPIQTIIIDKKGMLWIGTQGRGVFHYDGKYFRSISQNLGLPQLSIFSLLEGSRGNLWIGTDGGGLNYFNMEAFYSQIDRIPVITSPRAQKPLDGITLNIKTIDMRHGLNDQTVDVILEDRAGSIWVGTEAGINEITQNAANGTYEISSSGVNEGFTGGDVMINGGLIDKEGYIWWGTGKHLSRQSFKNSVIDTTTPQIYISEIDLPTLDKSWDCLKVNSDISYDSLTPWERLPANLEISYQHNHINFLYRGINWNEPEKTRYQYKLEGLNEDWSPVTSQTQISYANLVPKSYTFKVRAANSRGKWSPPSTFSFQIHPPFWQQLWFRLMLGILILIIGYAIYQWQTRQLEARWQAEALAEKQQELSRLVDERTIELKRSNQELERFAYIASHDLKTPLRSIISFIGLIERKMPRNHAADIKEYLGFAKDGAKHMHELIQGVLAFSQLEKIDKKQVSLDKILVQVKLNLQTLISEKNARINLSKLPDLSADRTQMIQLFQNLMENSITYNVSPIPEVSLSCTESDDFYEFQLTDNGIGIDPAYHERIFNMFVRLHPTQAYKGTGLGLALCDKVIKLHGGQIRLESKVGEGSMFYLRFPRD